MKKTFIILLIVVQVFTSCTEQNEELLIQKKYKENLSNPPAENIGEEDEMEPN